MRQVRFTVDPMGRGPLEGSETTVTEYTGSVDTLCKPISNLYQTCYAREAKKLLWLGSTQLGHGNRHIYVQGVWENI